MKIKKFFPAVRFTVFYQGLLIICVFVLAACNHHKRVGEKNEASKPAEINELAKPTIESTLKDILQNNGHNGNHFKIKYPAVVQYIYAQNNNAPLWTQNGTFLKSADSLLSLIDAAPYYGLFPQDYYEKRLSQLHRQLATDTASKENKLDVSLWAEADMLCTSAFVQLVKDLKAGRLSADTLSAAKESLTNPFFAQQLKTFQQSNDTKQFAASLEPTYAPYIALKEALSRFLEDTTTSKPDTATKERIVLYHSLQQRLGVIDPYKALVQAPDSADVTMQIIKFQAQNNIRQDGKVSENLLNLLGLNRNRKFLRFAVNLDRYKQLPPAMPDQYIWVNIPGFYLKLFDSTGVALESKVVVGKPQTRTPQLTSAITNMVTYPQWHIPQSIIAKDILPALKRDPGYLKRKGFSLSDSHDNEVDPYTVKWSKYEKAIPYKVIQGSGDANALGVLKFNFNNPYAVYLHDTNQRYLFGRSFRALSHGCVRVQQWEPLAHYILQNDSLYSVQATPSDSLQTWLTIGEKHVIPVRKRIPLFIRYFTYEVIDDKLVTFADIYGLDRELELKYFANKKLY